MRGSKRCRVVQPIPDHQNLLSGFPQTSHELGLVLGQGIRLPVRDSNPPGKLTNSRRHIAGDQRDPKPLRLERSNGVFGAFAQIIGKGKGNRACAGDGQVGCRLPDRICPQPLGATKAHGLTIPLPFDPFARHLTQATHLGGLDPSPAGGLCQRGGQRVAGSFGQGKGHLQILFAMTFNPVHDRLALCQGARLVKHDMINLCQTLHRRGGFEQHSLLKQRPRGGGGHRRHGKAKCTGAGDDQGRHRNIHRHAPVTTGIPDPEQKRRKRQQMHHRRINRGGLVGKRGIAVARGFRDRNKVRHTVQRAVLASRGHPHGQRAGQVDLPR